MQIMDKRRELSDRIKRTRLNLQKTDYKAIKFAEGELTAEEFAETLVQRRAWRAEINELQAELRAMTNNK